MANRLTKPATYYYVEAVPAVAARDAYCVTRTTTTLVGYKMVLVSVVDIDPNTGYGPSFYVVIQNGKAYLYELQKVYETTVTETCYPAVEAQAGVEGGWQQNADQDWNSSAQSIDPIENPGILQITPSQDAIGVVFGIAEAGYGVSPAQAEYGIAVVDGSLFIMESGSIVADPGLTIAAVPTLEIRVIDDQVSYVLGSWTYDSTVTLDTDKTYYMDVALYAGGDYVDDPTITAMAHLQPASGRIATTMGLSNAIYGLQSTIALSSYTNLSLGSTVTIDPQESSIQLSSSVTLSLRTNLAPSQGVIQLTSIDQRYPYARGEMTMDGFAIAGTLPETNLGFIEGEMEMEGGARASIFAISSSSVAGTLYLGVSAIGATGWAGDVSGEMDIAGWLAEEDTWGIVSGEMTLSGYTQYLSAVDAYSVNDGSVMVLIDGMTASASILVVFGDSLTLTSGIEEAALVIVGAMSDYLYLTSGQDTSALVELIFGDELLLRNDLPPSLDQRQYAVNTTTGAATRYTDHNFSNIVHAGAITYGVASDGVYTLPDSGSATDAYIDFGNLSPTGNATKLDRAYFAAGTDGTLYLRVWSNGTDRIYNVRTTGDEYRTKFGRGIRGREWGLRLEIVDATEFDFDAMDLRYTEVGLRRR